MELFTLDIMNRVQPSGRTLITVEPMARGAASLELLDGLAALMDLPGAAPWDEMPTLQDEIAGWLVFNTIRDPIIQDRMLMLLFNRLPSINPPVGRGCGLPPNAIFCEMQPTRICNARNALAAYYLNPRLALTFR